MMLKSVDLPQPDGPMIETNSPWATENETSSTAVIGPSRVAKRLLTRSTSSRRVPCEGTPASALMTASTLLPRRNLDQLGELFAGERCRRVLEIDRILHDH